MIKAVVRSSTMAPPGGWSTRTLTGLLRGWCWTGIEFSSFRVPRLYD